MKKSFLLFLLLICLAVGGLAGMSVWVSKDNEAVEVTQTTLQGDPAAAQGLTVTLRSQMFRNLFWDTQFPAGDAGQAQTRFQFYVQSQRSVSFDDRVPELAVPSFQGGTSTSGEFSPEELSQYWNGGLFVDPVAQLAKDMGPGQTKTVTVSLADYCDRFPIYMDNMYYRGDEEWRDRIEQEREIIQRFFDIPVPEGFQVTYTIATGGAGGVYEISVQDQQALCLSVQRAKGEGGYYYILDSHVSSEEAEKGDIQLDLSYIRDGYGVYFIPGLTERRVYDGGDLQPEKIRTVYPVQGERTVELCADEKGHLLLFTAAGDTWYLNVLSGDGQQLLQRLELGELGADTHLADPLEGENFLLFFSSQRPIYLLTWDGAQYALRHTLTMPEDEEWDSVGKKQTAHWDGQRLALLEQDDFSWEKIRCRLTVWEAEELTYQGEYALSFHKDNASQRQSNGDIRAAEEDAITLSG